MNESSKDPAAPGRAPRRRRLSGVQALGGVIAGFDYQVFRATKPPAELVEGARPVRGVSGEDGSLLTIGFPEDDEADADDIVGPTEDRPPARRPAGPLARLGAVE